MSGTTFSVASPAVVLLVDRDAASAAAFRRALAAHPDLQVELCGKPESATEAAASVRPAVVVLALAGPEGDLRAELARWSAVPGRPPVLVLAHRAPAAARKRAFAAGVADWLTELPEPDELAARLRVLARAVLAERDRDECRRDLVAVKRRLEERDLDLVGGVASRRRLDEFLDGEWRRARRNGSHLSVVVVEAAQADPGLALVLKGALRRGGDLLASCGDGRFAAVLPEVGAAGAATVARLLRQAAGAAVDLRIGAASLRPQDATGVGPETLLAEAQSAVR
jgi:two-component system, chemotaxis family, response regulator WspR